MLEYINFILGHDNFIPLCSLAISVIVAVEVIKNGRASRAHAKLSVRPSLIVVHEFTSKFTGNENDTQEVILRNAGAGAALIENYCLWYDEELLIKNGTWHIDGNHQKYMQKIGFNEFRPLMNATLSPESEGVPIATFQHVDENDRIEKNKKLKIMVEYRSLYGEMFVLSNSDIDE